eukprot:TRINITY_DN8761_c0_g7_i1.p1 TRINITY_DN8761_c0_g7~~TRINITY_DN8761_c0_g7_i1.p1  ORF type:complete len:101 (+),score=8.46 TRINITY_DN8761_c0_g7_i1:280-582(+)
MCSTGASTVYSLIPIKTISHIKFRMRRDDAELWCGDQVEVSSLGRLQRLVQVERELFRYLSPTRTPQLPSKRSCPLLYIPERPSNPMVRDCLFEGVGESE